MDYAKRVIHLAEKYKAEGVQFPWIRATNEIPLGQDTAQKIKEVKYEKLKNWRAKNREKVSEQNRRAYLKRKSI